ncbi:hypothetical protein HDE_07755 [Halotydeus destructor]|nr:hypothetical protein HDE_07755 [Halotydeus destructor]
MVVGFVLIFLALQLTQGEATSDVIVLVNGTVYNYDDIIAAQRIQFAMSLVGIILGVLCLCIFLLVVNRRLIEQDTLDAERQRLLIGQQELQEPPKYECPPSYRTARRIFNRYLSSST